MFQKEHLLWWQAHTPLSTADTVRGTEGLPETAPLRLSPPLGDEFCFAGSQHQHCGGHDHNNNQQETQDPCTRFSGEIAKVTSLQPCTCKIQNWQQGKTPAITPQSGRRLSRCCLTIPCLTSCAGVIGWKTEARGSHAVPSSLTTTTVLHCGSALSTNTYFPVSEKTWENLRTERNKEISVGKRRLMGVQKISTSLFVHYEPNATLSSWSLSASWVFVDVWRHRSPSWGYC